MVAPDEEESAAARLLELVPQGHEVRAHADGVALAVYVERGEAERLRGAFPSATFERVAPGWEHAWRSFHRPVTVAGIWIGPPWEATPPGAPAVVIDPGRAFGTGAHPTTRLCVEYLPELERGALLDVGCGSGVVAIAAAKLGFAPVVAVDCDPSAVEAAERNASANSVEVDVRLADASRDPLPAADVAVANIALGAVEAAAARLDCSELVASGYFAHEAPDVPGFRRVDRRTDAGWAADRLRRAAK